MNAQELIAGIPSSEAQSYEWIEWHKKLKKRYGKKEAKQVFLKGWYKLKNRTANDEQLRTYLRKQNIDIEADWEDSAIVFAKNPLGLVSLVGDTVTSVRFTIIALVIIAVLFLAVFLYNIAKDPNATLKTAMSLRTGGLI